MLHTPRQLLPFLNQFWFFQFIFSLRSHSIHNNCKSALNYINQFRTYTHNLSEIIPREKSSMWEEKKIIDHDFPCYTFSLPIDAYLLCEILIDPSISIHSHPIIVLPVHSWLLRTAMRWNWNNNELRWESSFISF
jgi:hypothetical protein